MKVGISSVKKKFLWSMTMLSKTIACCTNCAQKYLMKFKHEKYVLTFIFTDQLCIQKYSLNAETSIIKKIYI